MSPERRAGDGKPDRGRPDAESEAWRADAEQALSAADQASADRDQTSSSSDQLCAEADQSAADRDQAASDRNLAGGRDAGDWAATRGIRQRSTQRRAITARSRLDAAGVRDEIARSRDLIATARDEAADARDAEMDRQERSDRAADYRALAARHRRLAAADRRAAAADRELAAAERLQALAEREELARELSLAEADALTGARGRAAGLRELGLAVAHCQETGAALVLTYIDVVGLKRINDTRGHAAGDALLTQVAQLCRSHLRSDDIVIRLGGDEFLCATVAIPESFVRARFDAIAADLAATPGDGAIRTGFATLSAGDSVTDLIARADADLIRHRTPRADSAARPDPEATELD